MDAHQLSNYGEDRVLGNKPIPEWDVAGLLKLMWDTWHDVFREILGPAERSLVSEYSQEMLDYASQKNGDQTGRVEFRQRDLNEGLPDDVGTFELVSAFSAIHHLTDGNKWLVLQQIFNCLEPNGWFLFLDAMTIRFDDDVYRLGRQRHERRTEERFSHAGIEQSEHRRIEKMKAETAEDSPDKDRLARLDDKSFGFAK